MRVVYAQVFRQAWTLRTPLLMDGSSENLVNEEQGAPEAAADVSGQPARLEDREVYVHIVEVAEGYAPPPGVEYQTLGAEFLGTLWKAACAVERIMGDTGKLLIAPVMPVSNEFQQELPSSERNPGPSSRTPTAGCSHHQSQQLQLQNPFDDSGTAGELLPNVVVKMENLMDEEPGPSGALNVIPLVDLTESDPDSPAANLQDESNPGPPAIAEDPSSPIDWFANLKTLATTAAELSYLPETLERRQRRMAAKAAGTSQQIDRQATPASGGGAHSVADEGIAIEPQPQSNAPASSAHFSGGHSSSGVAGPSSAGVQLMPQATASQPAVPSTEATSNPSANHGPLPSEQQESAGQSEGAIDLRLVTTRNSSQDAGSKPTLQEKFPRPPSHPISMVVTMPSPQVHVKMLQEVTSQPPMAKLVPMLMATSNPSEVHGTVLMKQFSSQLEPKPMLREILQTPRQPPMSQSIPKVAPMSSSEAHGRTPMPHDFWQSQPSIVRPASVLPTTNPTQVRSKWPMEQQSNQHEPAMVAASHSSQAHGMMPMQQQRVANQFQPMSTTANLNPSQPNMQPTSGQLPQGQSQPAPMVTTTGPSQVYQGFPGQPQRPPPAIPQQMSSHGWPAIHSTAQVPQKAPQIRRPWEMAPHEQPVSTAATSGQPFRGPQPGVPMPPEVLRQYLSSAQPSTPAPHQYYGPPMGRPSYLMPTQGGFPEGERPMSVPNFYGSGPPMYSQPPDIKYSPMMAMPQPNAMVYPNQQNFMQRYYQPETGRPMYSQGLPPQQFLHGQHSGMPQYHHSQVMPQSHGMGFFNQMPPPPPVNNRLDHRAPNFPPATFAHAEPIMHPARPVTPHCGFDERAWGEYMFHRHLLDQKALVDRGRALSSPPPRKKQKVSNSTLFTPPLTPPRSRRSRVSGSSGHRLPPPGPPPLRPIGRPEPPTYPVPLDMPPPRAPPVSTMQSQVEGLPWRFPKIEPSETGASNTSPQIPPPRPQSVQPGHQIPPGLPRMSGGELLQSFASMNRSNLRIPTTAPTVGQSGFIHIKPAHMAGGYFVESPRHAMQPSPLQLPVPTSTQQQQDVASAGSGQSGPNPMPSPIKLTITHVQGGNREKWVVRNNLVEEATSRAKRQQGEGPGGPMASVYPNNSTG